MSDGARRPVAPLRAGQRRALLVLGDVAMVAVIGTAALALGARRSGWGLEQTLVRDAAAWWVLLSLLWTALAWANGLYDPRRRVGTWQGALLAVKVAAQIVVLWALLYFLLPPWTLVRHVLVFFAAGAAVAMPAWRAAYGRALDRPEFRRRLLVAGAGEAGRALVAAVREHGSDAIDIAGFVDDSPGLAGVTAAGLPVVGDRRSLGDEVERLGVTDVAVAITSGLTREMFEALMTLREKGVAITPMPLMYEELTGRVAVRHVGDHWAAALPLGGGRVGFYPLVRRGLDIAVALVGGIALLGVLPVIAPAVWTSSPGPLLYSQVRVGEGGRRFRMYKLRTMYTGAEPDGPVWASADDPRTTRIGRWLRRTRLDELPQVINILRGEMSVIGPRPERPEFVERLAAEIPFYRARLAVRPGLTGWAAVQQGYAASDQDALVKLEYDLYYIKNRSPMLDGLIVLRTLAAMLRLRGR